MKKAYFVLLTIFLAFFAANSNAQVCVAETEQELELSHPTDGSLYFVALDKNFSFQSTQNAVHTYKKGTTTLAFKTSSFTSSSPLPPALHFSVYNNAQNYEKLVDLTQTTVGGFSAYYIEYSSKSEDERGRVTAIYGTEFENKTKVYIIDLAAKQARFEEEKENYLRMLETFSLDPLDMCAVEDDTPNQPPNDANTSPADEPVQPIDGESGDDSSEEQQAPSEDNNSQGNGQGSTQPSSNKKPFTIFGFDGILVILAIIVVLLLLAVAFIVLVIVAVVVYYFFIKKKR